MNSKKSNDLMMLVGRIALSVIFIMGGWSKIAGFAGVVAYAAAFNVPFPEVAIVIAIVVELIGGLMVLVGYKTKWAALAIAVFLVPVTLIFHGNVADPLQMTMLMKNLAIIGGFLYVAAAGAGSYSVDAKKKPAAMPM